MPVLDLSFEWPVDSDGYEIVISQPKKLAKPPVVRQRSGRRSHLSSAAPAKAEPAAMLRRLGGPMRTVRPLDQSLLYVEFAYLDNDHSIIEFAKHYGYLGMFADPDSPDGERVELWRDHVARMRSSVDMWKRSPGFVPTEETHMANLKVSLVPLDGRAVLRLRPQSLFGAMQLQFAQALAAGTDIRSCDHCGKLFEIGGGARTRKARFCSDSCRSDYHVARRKQ